MGKCVKQEVLNLFLTPAVGSEREMVFFCLPHVACRALENILCCAKTSINITVNRVINVTN